MPCIGSDVLSYLAVSAGNSLFKLTIIVRQNKGKSVKLPAEKALMLTKPAFQLLDALGLVKGEHFRGMAYLLQSRRHLIAYLLSTAAAENYSRLFFKGIKLVVELVVLLV